MFGFRYTEEEIFGGKVILRYTNRLLVLPNGCIIWTGYTNLDGYGNITVSASGHEYKIQVHRYALMLALGLDYLPPQLQVNHTCNTPNCVNPMHLYLGTHKSNMRDMRNSGRQNNGGGVKLNQEIADSIYGSEDPIKYWMDKYDISRTTVKDVKHGRTWNNR